VKSIRRVTDQHFLGIRHNVNWVIQIEMIVTPKFARSATAPFCTLSMSNAAPFYKETQILIIHVFKCHFLYEFIYLLRNSLQLLGKRRGCVIISFLLAYSD
jgi:hypothetical protein